MVFMGEKEERKGDGITELDIKDKLILYELSHDARASISAIAKKTNLSRDIVQYRIKNLEKKRVVTGYTIAFNRRKTGYEATDIYLKILKLDKELLDYFINNDKVYWVATSEGKWNLCLSTNCESLVELKILLLEIKNRCGERLLDFCLLPLFYEEGVPHSYLLGGLDKPILMPRTTFSYEKLNTPKIKLDRLNKKLLSLLIKNSRTPLVILSKKLNTSVNTARNRINHLIKNNIIIQFETKISTVLMGYEWYLIFFKFTNIDEKKEKAFISYIKLDSRTHWLSYILGDWDFILSLHVKSNSDLNSFLSDIKKNFKEIIHDHEVLMIFKQYKHMNLF